MRAGHLFGECAFLAMYILIADDEGPKLENIERVVATVFPDSDIGTARSVRSALDVLRAKLVDILVLDMSLPTFNVAPGEQGGRPQNYGGIELLRYMDFYGVDCPVLIVTQYEAFPSEAGHVDLSSLSARLKVDHPGTFKGIIYYSGAADDGWRLGLETALQAVGGSDEGTNRRR